MAATDECALYADPELYNMLFPDARHSAAIPGDLRRERTLASEQFYVEEARRSGGPVLEVGCGSGRLTIAIAQNGMEVSAIDLSSTMLAAARSKAESAGVHIEFFEADMRGFDLGRRFSTILIAGNSLLHLLTNEELLQCLATVRRHLAADGRLIFDVSKWGLERLARDPAERHPVMSVMDPRLGEIAIEESAAYDSATQVRDIAWFLSTSSARDFRVIEYTLRVIFPQELLLLLDLAGFRLEARYGEFTRIPFDAASPRQVCVCSLRA
jgi:SAM-dependent methyltransferase